jgi:hypothetical protein
MNNKAIFDDDVVQKIKKTVSSTSYSTLTSNQTRCYSYLAVAVSGLASLCPDMNIVFFGTPITVRRIFLALHFGRDLPRFPSSVEFVSG